MENCIFCKIIAGEIPCYKVWEDEQFLAFLDVNPVKEGHTLLVPKQHINYYFEMSDELISQINIKAKLIAEKLKTAFKPKTGRIGLAVVGMGVPHVHLHLIPLDREADINPENAQKASPEQLKQALEKFNQI